jgi:mono/diheme cytochrome c family protein
VRALVAPGLGLCLWAAAATVAHASEVSDLFSDKCEVCHGENGKGQTRMGKKFHSPDFTSAKWQAKTSDEAARHTIEDGVVIDGQVRMPPWKEKLTPQQITDLIKYARSFGKH